MSYRTFAPGVYDGERVEFRTIAQRKALIGKRIGYDLRGSSLMHHGTVTDADRYEIEVDGSRREWRQYEQIVVLRKQPA